MTTRDRRSGELGDWGVLGFGVLVGVAVIALLVAAYAIGAMKGRADAQEEAAATAAAGAPIATETSPAATAVDREALTLFASTCGACHTLTVAGTSGTVGPNLDAVQPTAEQVLAAIENGGAGSGQMPAGLLSGADAERVAEFVGAAASG